MGEQAPNNNNTGTLYVVATPIGNLEDITLRALKILGDVDLIAAEDTRHTKRLLTAHRIENRLISYHEHNEQQRTRQLLDQLKKGATIALVSDAGTPTISDPGYRLVQAASAHHIPVIPIPGVSAAIAALSASGLTTNSFTFIGFPTRKKAKRIDQLKILAQLPHTLIFYQSPRRMLSFIEELKTTMGDRPGVLARELTKRHEEMIHGTLSEISAELNERSGVKGECTLLVSGLQPVRISEKDLDATIRAALATHQTSPLSAIAKSLAKQYNLPRKTIYAKALQIKKQIKM